MIDNIAATVPDAWFSAASTAYLLICLAEFGDKSQLVCMTLAARHRGLPVALGAMAAFALLNLLAVVFGAAIAAWLPDWVVTTAVIALFAGFGINALRHEEDDPDEPIEEKPGHSVFATSFLLIFLAEFGDKTQLAVAGLGSTASTSAVWAGATAALTTTSLLGVYAGRRLINRLPLHWIHRSSGVLFLLLAAYATTRLF